MEKMDREKMLAMNGSDDEPTIGNKLLPSKNDLIKIAKDLLESKELELNLSSGESFILDKRLKSEIEEYTNNIREYGAEITLRRKKYNIIDENLINKGVLKFKKRDQKNLADTKENVQFKRADRTSKSGVKKTNGTHAVKNKQDTDETYLQTRRSNEVSNLSFRKQRIESKQIESTNMINEKSNGVQSSRAQIVPSTNNLSVQRERVEMKKINSAPAKDVSSLAKDKYKDMPKIKKLDHNNRSIDKEEIKSYGSKLGHSNKKMNVRGVPTDEIMKVYHVNRNNELVDVRLHHKQPVRTEFQDPDHCQTKSGSNGGHSDSVNNAKTAVIDVYSYQQIGNNTSSNVDYQHQHSTDPYVRGQEPSPIFSPTYELGSKPKDDINYPPSLPRSLPEKVEKLYELYAEKARAASDEMKRIKKEIEGIEARQKEGKQNIDIRKEKIKVQIEYFKSIIYHFKSLGYIAHSDVRPDKTRVYYVFTYWQSILPSIKYLIYQFSVYGELSPLLPLALLMKATAYRMISITGNQVRQIEVKEHSATLADQLNKVICSANTNARLYYRQVRNKLQQKEFEINYPQVFQYFKNKQFNVVPFDVTSSFDPVSFMFFIKSFMKAYFDKIPEFELDQFVQDLDHF